ncbi:hypothetical protein FE257_010931 [Aspergillus nanangensis]|uniref:Mucin-7 n=1 Tax=Aspergillus nanangensis TaxID=2582783 RepID=A0AAD4CVS5_ASPNN|nr:hypothetical protein FE257_010931 [Aspergillus nanangensis]
MDPGGHPGVRSLLARFENQKASSTSPPSRGRSPAASDTPGSTRPLSKVRASFVAVDGAVQSSPVAGLRRSASTRSDSPAPPARVRSFCSDELEVASLKSPLSPAPTSNGAGAAPLKPTEQVPDNTTQETLELVPALKAQPQVSSVANKENRPDLTPSAKTDTASQKGKTTPMPAPKSSSTKAKTSATKADTDKSSKPTRPVKPAREITHKPSQTTLNTANKTATRTTTRPARSSMPTTGAAKSTASSTTKTARLPGSATTPNLAAPKTASTAAAKSTLSRKPSSLKPSNQPRAITPTASTSRKQAPRTAGRQSAERPNSRVSNGSSKPVDEGFLARMMRPTASSASKAHEKTDVKSPPKGNARPAVKKAAPKPAPRLAKAKAESEKLQAQVVAEPSKPKEELVEVSAPAPALEEAPVETSETDANLDETAEWVEQHGPPSVAEEVATSEEAKETITPEVVESVKDNALEVSPDLEEAIEEPSLAAEANTTVLEQSTDIDLEVTSTPSKPDEILGTAPEALADKSPDAVPSPPDELVETTPEAVASEQVPSKSDELIEGVDKLSLS